MDYFNRKSLLEDPTHYTLTDEGIAVTSEKSGPMGTIAYQDIRSLHLSYAPSRVQANRYLADISAGHQTIRLASERFLGPMDFEDQGEAYRSWILELQRRLIQKGHKVNCSGGASALSWWSNLGCLSIVFLAVIGITLFLAVSLNPLALVKIALIVFFFPRAIRWFKRNRPSKFALGSIPSSILPASAHGNETPPPPPTPPPLSNQG